LFDLLLALMIACGWLAGYCFVQVNPLATNVVIARESVRMPVLAALHLAGWSSCCFSTRRPRVLSFCYGSFAA